MTINWMIILALLGLTTTIIAHLLAFVWVMSAMNTTLTKLSQRFDKMEEREKSYVKREDYDGQVTKRDIEIHGMKKDHNDLRNKFEDCRVKGHAA